MDKLDSVILFVIDQTSKMAKQHSQREFDRLGLDITIDQWVLLKVIEKKKTLSQSELAIDSHRDPASITRSVDLLEKKGFVRRHEISGNRRKYNLSLTIEGRSFVNKHMTLVNGLRAQSIKGMSKKEVQQLLELLYKMQKNFS